MNIKTITEPARRSNFEDYPQRRPELLGRSMACGQHMDKALAEGPKAGPITICTPPSAMLRCDVAMLGGLGPGQHRIAIVWG